MNYSNYSNLNPKDITADGFLLPEIVKSYLAEKEEEKLRETFRKEKTYGPVNALR
jgi:uncharacterized membrane protein